MLQTYFFNNLKRKFRTSANGLKFVVRPELSSQLKPREKIFSGYLISHCLDKPSDPERELLVICEFADPDKMVRGHETGRSQLEKTDSATGGQSGRKLAPFCCGFNFLLHQQAAYG
jgi:hypothetical protein